MSMLTKLKTSFALFVVGALLMWPNLSLASTTDGTINSANKYAWSENIGWLNFGTSTGNIHVTDTAITGYAWSPTYGWINMAPTTSGVTNNGEGDLSGYAWGENTGWINFGSVSIDTTGYFTGYASGDVTGQVSLNCSNTSSCSSSDFKVQTDWRPASQRGGSTGIISSVSQSKPQEPINQITQQPAGFAVQINNGAGQTNSRAVSLTFTVGSDTKRMAISNEPDFTTASQIPYEAPYQWSLLPGAGQKTVYVKFFTQWGVASDTVSANILLTDTPTNNEPDNPLTPPGQPGTDNQEPNITVPQFANGNLVKEINKPDVYLIDWEVVKRPILSGEVFLACGFSWGNIIEVTNLDNYTTGFPITMLECQKTALSGQTSQDGGLGQYQQIKAQPTFSKDLAVGMQDPEVKLVQQFLNQHGYTIASSGVGSPGHETDYYGNLTAAAVSKLQKTQGLTANGQWNAATRQIANAQLASPATTPPINKLAQPDPAVLGEKIANLPSAVFNSDLKIGMINEDVRRLQQLLASRVDLYPNGQITGKFGALTLEAVQRFQTKYNVTTPDHPAYGYVGPATRAKLLEVFGQ